MLGGSSGRNGYLRFDADPGEIIYGIKLDNQANNHDGILYDHLTFKPAAPPANTVPDEGVSSSILLGASCLAMAAYRNRKRTTDLR